MKNLPPGDPLPDASRPASLSKIIEQLVALPRYTSVYGTRRTKHRQGAWIRWDEAAPVIQALRDELDALDYLADQYELIKEQQ